VKPIDSFWRRWEVLRDRCLQRRDETHIAVVGGGAGGVELLLSVQYRLTQLLAQQGRSAKYLRFHLLTATGEILQAHNIRVRSKFVRVLAERGVDVRTACRVARVLDATTSEDAVADTGAAQGKDVVAGTGAAQGKDVVAGAGAAQGEDAPTPTAPTDLPRPYRVEFESGGHLDLDEVLWVTTARAASWPGDSGLDVDERGFIKVRDTLQTLSHPDIFAVGDVAAVIDYPRPKAGVFAVRQGPPLTRNLRASLVGEPAEPFRPQEKFLSLISTGDRYAVASRGEWAVEGAWAWHWKDRIDRRFMESFNELPAMDPVDSDEVLEAISVPAMRCGGCGSKVGATLLGRVLRTLQPISRADVVVGLDAVDDAAVVEVPAGKQLVQTVDFFRAFVEDPYVFGQVAANHALGDVFAMGAAPQTALAMVTIPYGREAKLESDLLHLLSGALQVLNTENTALVGGHTSEGEELAMGFAINGLVDAGAAIGKRGMRPGDGLILTKPLGTGALFAADMRGRAKGRWIEQALRSMTQSSRAAAATLIEHGATAMTDVTGFGILGHLVEMLAASGVGATLDLAAVPALDGAVEVMRAGVFSSLQPENERLRRAIANLDEAASHPAFPLVFDPQTAGGLLASVPADNVEACVNALRAGGYGSAVAVGAVHEAETSQASIRVLL